MTDPYAKIDPENPKFWQRNDVALGYTAMEFIGIYSGRVPSQEGDAALGLCWKESAIRDICTAKKIGPNPHI